MLESPSDIAYDKSMDLNRAYWFIRIVEAGNISKAAELLNEPKTKLSRNLALLEEELGVQLVYRTTRQFKLTEAGLLFFQKAKNHMEGLLEAASSIKDEGEEISGLLKVTAPDDIGVYVLTDIVNEFGRIHPQVKFELLYTNQVLDLVKLSVDVAIRIGHLKDSTLIQRKAGNIDFILASSPRYLDRHKAILNPEELKHHQTIGFSSQEINTWRLISKNKKCNLKLKHKYVANNFTAIRDLIISGHGIAYLPRFLCESYLASGELVHILKPWGDEGSPIQIAVPHQKNKSRKLRAFIDFATKRFSEQF